MWAAAPFVDEEMDAVEDEADLRQRRHRSSDRRRFPPASGGFAMLDAAIGLRVRAARYREEHELSDVVASRDLRKLVDEELLIPHGEKGAAIMSGSDKLTEIAARVKVDARADDPYEMVKRRAESEASPRLF